MKFSSHFLLAVFLLFTACNRPNKANKINKSRNKIAYFDKQQSKDSAILFFTTNQDGYIEPCGCTANALGGLQRMTTLIENGQQSFNNRMLYIDGGNLLFQSATKPTPVNLCQDKNRIDFLLNRLKAVNLEATVIGPKDSANGLTWVKNLYKRKNISTFGQGQNMSVILKHGIGATAFSLSSASTQNINHSRVFLEKQIITLKKEGAKSIVVFAQASVKDTKTVLTGLKNQNSITAVVLSRDPGTHPSLPEKFESTLLIRNGSMGQYLGAIEFNFLGNPAASKKLAYDDRESIANKQQELLKTRIESLGKQLKATKPKAKTKIEFLKNRIQIAETKFSQMETHFSPLSTPNFKIKSIPITRHIPPNKEAHEALSNFELNQPSITEKCEEGIECPKLMTGQASYVGAKTCKTCHEPAYKFWEKAQFKHKFLNANGNEEIREVGHSKAWRTLVDKKATKDRSCIGCHSIGFNKAGGYCKVNDVDFRKNVQCESCHGPGSLHAKTGKAELINRKVPEETCRACHHVPHIESYKSFNYEEKLKKILGPGHGEK